MSRDGSRISSDRPISNRTRIELRLHGRHLAPYPCRLCPGDARCRGPVPIPCPSRPRVHCSRDRYPGVRGRQGSISGAPRCGRWPSPRRPPGPRRPRLPRSGKRETGDGKRGGDREGPRHSLERRRSVRISVSQTRTSGLLRHRLLSTQVTTGTKCHPPCRSRFTR